jgi:hypothetical protein
MQRRWSRVRVELRAVFLQVIGGTINELDAISSRYTYALVVAFIVVFEALRRVELV